MRSCGIGLKRAQIGHTCVFSCTTQIVKKGPCRKNLVSYQAGLKGREDATHCFHQTLFAFCVSENARGVAGSQYYFGRAQGQHVTHRFQDSRNIQASPLSRTRPSELNFRIFHFAILSSENFFEKKWAEAKLYFFFEKRAHV